MSKKIQAMRKSVADTICAIGMMAAYFLGCLTCPQDLQRAMDAREER